jgi:hypothetical protein
MKIRIFLLNVIMFSGTCVCSYFYVCMYEIYTYMLYIWDATMLDVLKCLYLVNLMFW